MNMKTLKKLSNPEPLISRLSENFIENSGFIFTVSQPDSSFDIFADKELTAAVCIERDGDHCMFWGNWKDIEIPFDILPKNGIFVSASAPDIIEILKQHFELEGEWPCWHYLGPDGYGPGPWDDLRPLTDEDVEFVALNWTLGGDNREKHIRDKVEKFDSACIRIDGQLIAWCGLHFEIGGVGNLGFAHTLDQHRRKGYSSEVTKTLVNRLSLRNMRVTAHVIKDNEASISLCTSLGFKNIGELSWAMFKPR